MAIARLGTKYGLRSKECDEEALFQALRPGQAYVKLRIQAHYKVHPLPFGSQRHNVAQLLKQWGWQARPLQPERGDSQGAAWLVGASEEPPALTQPMGSGFVLISKVKELGSKKAPVGGVRASAKTRKQILLDDDPDVVAIDPWIDGGDPWSQAKASSEHIVRSEARQPSSGATKLAEIEAALRADFQELKQQVTLPTPVASNSDRRIAALKVGFTEMRQQNAKFEEWFQTFGSKVNDQAADMQTLQSTVAEQRQELEQCKADVKHSVSQAVGSLQQDLSAQMTVQLQSQFEQIQALFSEKKARTN